MDNILYEVYFNKETNKVRIVDEELTSRPSERRQHGEVMLGQTEGSENARHLEMIIRGINSNVEVEIIGEG